MGSSFAGGRGLVPLVSLVLGVVTAFVPVAGAATDTSSLLAWGYNASGGLGNGTTTTSSLPVKVKLPKATVVTAMSGGSQHTLALTSGGSVLAWGFNLDGELGDGTTTGPQRCGGFPCSKTPVKVKLPKGVKVIAVSAGYRYSLAVTSTGSVLAWGRNATGELGDGKMVGSDLPVKVKLPRGVKVIAVSAGFRHSLAVTSTGSLLGWGNNHYGELGQGNVASASDVPIKVRLSKGVKVAAVAAGGDFSLALTSTGSLLAWGRNQDGELGHGSARCASVRSLCSTRPRKVKLPRGTRVAAVAAGGDFSLALTSTGSLLAWGDNSYGDLGDGTATGPETCRGAPCSTRPVKVALPKGVKVAAVAAGGDFSLALTSTGSLLAWGDNFYGELGDGTTTGPQTCSGSPCSPAPVKVDLPAATKAKAVAAGEYHSLALVHHT